MAIEEYFSEGLKIKNLSIETPANKQPTLFDPEREIGIKDWNFMVRTLQNFHGGAQASGDWRTCCNMARNMSIIFPDRFSQLGIDRKFEQGVKAQLRKFKKDWEIDEYIVEMSDLKVAMRKSNVQHRLDRSEYQIMESELDDMQPTPERAAGFIIFASSMKILFPERPTIDEKKWKNVKEYLVRYRKSDIVQRVNFYPLLAQLRIAFPEKFVEVKPNQGDWEYMREKMNSLRMEHDWRGFARLVAAMNTLAAEKIEIIRNGIKFVAAGQPLDVETSLPLTRKF